MISNIENVSKLSPSYWADVRNDVSDLVQSVLAAGQLGTSASVESEIQEKLEGALRNGEENLAEQARQQLSDINDVRTLVDTVNPLFDKLQSRQVVDAEEAATMISAIQMITDKLKGVSEVEAITRDEVFNRRMSTVNDRNLSSGLRRTVLNEGLDRTRGTADEIGLGSVSAGLNSTTITNRSSESDIQMAMNQLAQSEASVRNVGRVGTQTEQFDGVTERYRAGEISEEEFNLAFSKFAASIDMLGDLPEFDDITDSLDSLIDRMEAGEELDGNLTDSVQDLVKQLQQNQIVQEGTNATRTLHTLEQIRDRTATVEIDPESIRNSIDNNNLGANFVQNSAAIATAGGRHTDDIVQSALAATGLAPIGDLLDTSALSGMINEAPAKLLARYNRSRTDRAGGEEGSEDGLIRDADGNVTGRTETAQSLGGAALSGLRNVSPRITNFMRGRSGRPASADPAGVEPTSTDLGPSPVDGEAETASGIDESVVSRSRQRRREDEQAELVREESDENDREAEASEQLHAAQEKETKGKEALSGIMGLLTGAFRGLLGLLGVIGGAGLLGRLGGFGGILAKVGPLLLTLIPGLRLITKAFKSTAAVLKGAFQFLTTSKVGAKVLEYGGAALDKLKKGGADLLGSAKAKAADLFKKMSGKAVETAADLAPRAAAKAGTAAASASAAVKGAAAKGSAAAAELAGRAGPLAGRTAANVANASSAASMNSVGGVANKVVGLGAGAAKGVGKLIPFAPLAFAAGDAAEGFVNPSSIVGKDEKDVSLGNRADAAVVSALSGLTLGAISPKQIHDSSYEAISVVSETYQGLAESVSDWWNGESEIQVDKSKTTIAVVEASQPTTGRLIIDPQGFNATQLGFGAPAGAFSSARIPTVPQNRSVASQIQPAKPSNAGPSKNGTTPQPKRSGGGSSGGSGAVTFQSNDPDVMLVNQGG